MTPKKTNKIIFYRLQSRCGQSNNLLKLNRKVEHFIYHTANQFVTTRLKKGRKNHNTYQLQN